MPIRRPSHTHFSFTRAALLLLLVVGLAGQPPSAAQAAALTFTVTSAADLPDSNLGDGICNDGTGSCTLRAAIEQASNLWAIDNQPRTIDIDGTVSGSIFSLSNAYGPVVWSGSKITLNGNSARVSGLSLNGTMFRIEGDQNTLNSLTLMDARGSAVTIGEPSQVPTALGKGNTLNNITVLNSTQEGVAIYGGEGRGLNNTILNSYFGLPFSELGACQDKYRNRVNVGIHTGASGNLIQQSNLMCASEAGVVIDGADSSGNTLYGSRIGVTFTYPTGNAGVGVLITGAPGTLLDYNAIAGNGSHGVDIKLATGTVLRRNLIGMEFGSSAAAPNLGDGVRVEQFSANTLVGTSDPAHAAYGNTISGNAGSGVRVTFGSTGTVVDGNTIGLDPNKITPVPNGGAGVTVTGEAVDTSVGSTAVGIKQYISGNTGPGVSVGDSTRTTLYSSNQIGVNVSNGPAGNGQQGIAIDGGSGVKVLSPVVAFNGGAGVSVTGSTAIDNFIRFGLLHANAGLGVDLGDDGPTYNGAHSPPGPNGWQRYPTFSRLDAGVMYGRGCAGCTVFFYTAGTSPILGALYPAGSALVDAQGGWSFTLAPGKIPSDYQMMACATATSGSCSEFALADNLKHLYLPLATR